MRSFLECCAEIETLAALIYQELEKKAAGNEQLAGVMRKLAEDEEAHALQLRFALRMRMDDAFTGVNQKVGDPHLLKARAEELLAQARAGALNEYELLKVAVELENDFRVIHAGYALLFKDAKTKKMFDALARDDQLHMAELGRYLQEYKERQRSGEQ